MHESVLCVPSLAIHTYFLITYSFRFHADLADSIKCRFTVLIARIKGNEGKMMEMPNLAMVQLHKT